MKNNLENIKIGDIVDRYFCVIPKPMKLKVTAITDKLIVCGDWTFDKYTGGEVDAYLGWDGTNTGSYIVFKNVEVSDETTKS
jgi:hypothetical protein